MKLVEYRIMKANDLDELERLVNYWIGGGPYGNSKYKPFGSIVPVPKQMVLFRSESPVAFYLQVMVRE